MPRHRSRTSPVSTASPKRPSPPGLLHLIQTAGSSPSPPVTEERAAVKARQDALRDLVGVILVGPPSVFPIKASTGQALFGLAVDWLAQHDKTTAEALRRFAALHGRLELLDLRTSTEGLPPLAFGAATLEWLLSEPSTYSVEDLPDDFDRYRQAIGKRTCHPWTLRRQDELLRAYGRAYNYPAGARARRVQRPAWVREHLLAMIAEAQVVPCWHPQPDLTDQDRDRVMREVDELTSLAKLSALVLTQLHSTTIDYLLKRLLPRRRQ